MESTAHETAVDEVIQTINQIDENSDGSVSFYFTALNFLVSKAPDCY